MAGRSTEQFVIKPDLVYDSLYIVFVICCCRVTRNFLKVVLKSRWFCVRKTWKCLKVLKIWNNIQNLATIPRRTIHNFYVTTPIVIKIEQNVGNNIWLIYILTPSFQTMPFVSHYKLRRRGGWNPPPPARIGLRWPNIGVKKYKIIHCVSINAVNPF